MKDILLEAKGISHSFGGVKAVQNVSFYIARGEVLGLIGPNGSGKSTIVNMITGVVSLDTGEVIYEGKTLNQRLGIAQRCRLGMARTFQSPRPFGNLSVYNNIFAIALLKYNFAEAAKKTEYILELTGLKPLECFISSKLSVEKRKWLDLARALATEPKLIMMDEVMAGLNPSEMEESLKLVRKINQEEGTTILFIEHVMRAVVNVCSRVIVLNEGRLLCEGQPDEVLRRKEVVEAYLGGGYSHA